MTKDGRLFQPLQVLQKAGADLEPKTREMIFMSSLSFLAIEAGLH